MPEPTRSIPSPAAARRLLLGLAVALFAAGAPGAASAQVCGGTTVTTQAEVDALSCTDFSGSLTIGPSADITDLSPLAGVTSVGDTLFVTNNAALTNLDGLSGITSIGADLGVTNNVVLDEFCGLFPLLDALGLAGTYNVSSNLANPTQGDILAAGACPLLVFKPLSVVLL